MAGRADPEQPYGYQPHHLTGLTNDQAYQVRVRTLNDEGASDWSAPVSGAPTAGSVTVQASNEPSLAVPWLYWTDARTGRIQRAELDGSDIRTLVSGLGQPRDLALDRDGGRMYWTDYGSDKIRRANLDGSRVEDLVTGGLKEPFGIALDVAGGKMYWTDWGTDKIQRANLDGSGVEDLVTTGLNEPYGLALDVAGGKMYWTDWGSDKIQRANLDGSGVEDLVTGLNQPRGIALDLGDGRMYWADWGTDKIQRANLDGSGVEDLVTSAGLLTPQAIALDAGGGKMYWTDYGTDKIQRANLNGSQVEDLVTSGLNEPYGLALGAGLPAQIFKAGGDPATLNLAGRFRDPDGGAVTLSVSSSDEAVATAALADSQVTIAPVAPGQITVAVTARDERGRAATLLVPVTVYPPNRPPVVAQAPADRKVRIDSLARVELSEAFTDPDVGDVLTYTATSSNEAVATAAVEGSGVNIAPKSPGQARVSVTARDPEGLEASLSFGVTVEPKPPPPPPPPPRPPPRPRPPPPPPPRPPTTNQVPVFDEGASTNRSVAENTPPDRNIGNPVGATDPEGRAVSYSLTGGDTDRFTIIPQNGQLRTRTGVDYNYEAQNRYSVTVEAQDEQGGRATLTVTIDITDDDNERPERPDRPSVTASTLTSLTVGWTEPGNTGPPITDYNVQYREGSSGPFTSVAHDGPGRTTTISNLKSNTTYQIQVQATSDEGTSEWSPSGNGRTVANQAPTFNEGSRTTRRVAENTTGTQDVGNPITATDGDGGTMRYLLGGTDQSSFTLDGNQLQTIAGVAYDYEEKNSYEVIVRAEDDQGGSNTIEVTINLTDQQEPPETPSAPRVIPASSTSLTVTWTEPVNTGPDIDGYDVQYREGDSGGFTSWTHNGAERTATITGRSPGTSYQVQVRARNDEGASGWSPSGTGSTDPNQLPVFTDGSSATRRLDENTTGVVDVGDPVGATDPENTTLTYSLQGTDADSFTVHSGSGQLRTRSGKTWDYETKPRYVLRVKATDGHGGERTILVLIDLIDVNEAPVFIGDGTFDSAENAPSAGRVEARDLDNNDGITGYTISGGDDRDLFEIDSGGALTFKDAPDFEDPADNGRNNQYSVVLTATGGAGGRALTAQQRITVTVEDVNEPPGKPDPPTVSDETENSLTVTWTEPANTGPDIANYFVQYRTSGAFTDWPDTGPSLTRTITGLSSGSTYQIQVQAENAEGKGAWSNSVNGTTLTAPTDAPPEISALTFTVDEGKTAVATLTAEDQDTAAADLEWSKAGGADAGRFTLSTAGVLAFAAAPDYENPGDADADRTYEVTVQVSDGTHTDTEDVVVTVKNVDEAGTVSLFPAQLRVRMVVRATLTDPDGDLSAVSWRWAESSDKTTWTNIDGATQADYLPTEARRGKYLRATATRYRDGEGSNKTSRTESNAVVGEREPGPELSVKTLVSGLRYPWGIAFTPDGTMLFTERDGHPQQDPLPDPPEGLSSRLTDGTLQTVSADFSDLDTDENGGVMGLEVDPDFVDNRRIYICQQRTGSVIQVVAWTIDATYTTATRANDPLVGNIPRVDNHNGCRLRFGPDGNLWISTGDTEAIGTVPQDLNSLGGKILRVDPLTGAAPADNPFPGSLVYSYGHRNPQGLALRPGTRQMWSVEHGPTVDDEINLLVPGANYGWDPVPTDENGDPTSGYDDTAPMTDLVKFPGAIEARWSSGNPTLATSGGIFLEGEQWGLWEGRLAVATLKGRSLRIFEFTEDGTFVSHVVPEELDHFGDRDHRLRTPMIGPDNALYLSTSTRGWRDEILRVTPQQAPEFPNDADTRQVTENTGGDMVVATVEATDYNHDELTYTLGGTDGESFYILDENIGELRVRSTTQLDYETRREYEVTVTATDDQNTSDTVTLTIEVTDVEHEGTVTLSSTQPQVGSPFQASLSDADGGVTATTWKWERSDDGVTGWEDIDGARSASYTPGADDIGKYLRATATYTNTHGPGKTAQSVTSGAVGAAPNSNPEFPSASLVRRVAEHTATGQPIDSPVEADDADGDPLQYALSGMDADLFDINSSTGQLLTRAALDYEVEDEYEVVVSVSDGKDTNDLPDDNEVDDSVRVTIEVTNVDEPGSVSLFPAQLRAWTVVRAALSDPDGVDLHAVSWQWEESSDKTAWTRIDGATQADYTPTDSVQGQYLRATAGYTDGQGTGKTTEVVSDHVVGEREPGPELTVVPLVSGLSVPWGIAFAPDGTLLFTERGDRLSSRLTDGTVQSVSADFDDLLVSGEAGLMAIVVDPAFASNRRFYTCQAHTGPEVQVIAWTIDANYTAATRADDPLVDNIPAASQHSGCRLRFGPEGYLWIATGDASSGTVPQDRNSLGGKVLRVNSSTGAAAPGNPFGTRVYTYGHRNPQGLARRPGTNQMWSVEHGPTVDDEINLLSAGGNYGWDPVPSYNEGVPMTDLVKFPGAVEARWSSGNHTLATSGGIFLEGEDWGEWDGRLAIATLKGRSLRVFEFSASGAFMSHVVAPGLDGAYGRLRTPMLGPDGALYVTTSNGAGADRILRVTASRAPAFLTDTQVPHVEENSSASDVVARVLALDPKGETLTYTLSGPDAPSFNIADATVGELRAKVALDYETRSSYEVIVTATNPGGFSDSVTLTINVTDVNEPPGKPDPPTVSDETESSLTATWTEPANTGPDVTNYHMQYRISGAFTDWPDTGPSLTRTITGLSSGSTYQIRVQAENDEGKGAWSNSVNGTTLTAPLPTILRGPYLQSGTSSSVIIKWRTDEATDSLVRYGLDHDPDGLHAVGNELRPPQPSTQCNSRACPPTSSTSIPWAPHRSRWPGGTAIISSSPLPSPARRSRRESGSSEIPAPPTGVPEPSEMPFSISRGRATRTSGSCWATTPMRTEPMQSTRRQFSRPTRRCCERSCSGRPSEIMTALQPTRPPKAVPITTFFPSLATAKPAESPPGRKPITPSTTGICTSLSWTPTKPIARRTGR